MKKWNKKFRNIFNSKSKWITILFPVILLGVFFYLMTMRNVYLKTYEIEKFNRAAETIRSPISVENEAETERKTRETVLSVSDRYTIMAEIINEKISNIKELFDEVEKFNRAAETIRSPISVENEAET